jgi:hypothetical protein
MATDSDVKALIWAKGTGIRWSLPLSIDLGLLFGT